MTKVSVIVPNYNHAIYLKQRIDSILNQTFQDFELIILDDNSKDESRSVIELYRNHPKITHIVYNELNSGTTFKQWKKGIELASGEYIWIAESDDYCSPEFLEELYEGIKNNPSIVLAFGQLICFSDNNILWKTEHPKIKEVLSGHDFACKYMLGANVIPNASGVLFRKDVYAKLSANYLDFKFCGDWYFWIEIMQYGQIFISGKYLNYFRKHQKDVSGNAIANGLDFSEGFHVFDRIKCLFAPSDLDIRNALQVIYNKFEARKAYFKDEEIKKNSIELIERYYSQYNIDSPFNSTITINKKHNFIDKSYYKLRKILSEQKNKYFTS